MGFFSLPEMLDLPPEHRDVFIDTGAHIGYSMELALKDGFKTVLGIELFSKHLATSHEKFKDNPNVRLFTGSSHEMLPEVLASVYGRRVVVWHDAHFQGVDRVNEYDAACGECPLIHELHAVMDARLCFEHAPLMCIDDAQLFYPEFWEKDPLAKNFNREEWPTINQIVLAVSPYYTVERRLYANNTSHVLICTPAE